MAAQPIDEEKAEAFSERMVDVLNHGALALMVSIGHRTRLFDTLSTLPPAGTVEIARATGLHERYVREWLGAMVVGGVVDHDPQADTYSLPSEHAAFLTRAAAPDNLAAFAQYVGLLGAVEDRIVECFKNGGGVPYSAYGRFQEVMAEDSGQSVLPALLDRILPLVPGAKAGLDEGIDVLDVGCGTGLALILMAKAFPVSRFRGYDIDGEAIARGNAEAAQQGVGNLRLEVRDVATLNGSHSFDLITAFDAVHDQAQPDKVLENIANALRPGGTFLMQDIRASSHVHGNKNLPIGTLLYTISCMHCMSVSLANGGPGLGAMWGEETALRMLREAGFNSVRVERLPHDIQNQYYVAAKD